MQTYTLKARSPPTLDLITWVAEEPQKATKVGAGLIVVGVAILILAAIFSS
jgi:hypothetical protein